MAVGMFGYLGVGVESSGGTASHSVDVVDFLPFVSENLSKDTQRLESQAITGTLDVLDRCPGPDTIGGSVTVEVQPATIGYLFRSWFDQTTTAQGSGAATNWQSQVESFEFVTIHRFVAGQTQFQSGSGSDVPTLTFHKYVGPGPQSTGTESSFAYYQMAANTFEMTIDTGQMIRATFDFIGRKFGRTAAVTPTVPEQVCVTGVQASVSLDGAGDAAFQTLTVRGNNGLDNLFTLNGTVNAEQLKRNAFRGVEVSGTLSFQDHTQMDRFINDSEGELAITITTDDEIESGAPYEIKLTMPAFQYQTISPNIQGPGFISVPFQGNANYHSGSGTALEVLIVNSRSNSYDVNSNA